VVAVAVPTTGDANGVATEVPDEVGSPCAFKVIATMVDAALNGSDDEGAFTPILQADIAKTNMPKTAKSFMIGFIVFFPN